MPKVVIPLTEEDYVNLKKYAEKELRSITNLTRKFVLDALNKDVATLHTSHPAPILSSTPQPPLHLHPAVNNIRLGDLENMKDVAERYREKIFISTFDDILSSPDDYIEAHPYFFEEYLEDSRFTTDYCLDLLTDKKLIEKLK